MFATDSERENAGAIFLRSFHCSDGELAAVSGQSSLILSNADRIVSGLQDTLDEAARARTDGPAGHDSGKHPFADLVHEFLSIIASGKRGSHRQRMLQALGDRCAEFDFGPHWILAVSIGVTNALTEIGARQISGHSLELEFLRALPRVISHDTSNVIVACEAAQPTKSHDSRSQGSPDVSKQWTTVAEKVDRLLGETLDPFDAMDAVASAISDIIPCDRFSVVVSDPDADDFKGIFVAGLTTASDETAHVIPPGLLESVHRDSDYRVLDLPQLERLADELVPMAQLIGAGIKQALMLPLRAGGRIIGVAGFFSINADHFQEQHVRFGSLFAARLSGAMQVASLASDLRRQLDESTALAGLAGALSSGVTLDEALDHAADRIKSVVPYDRFSLNVFDQDGTLVQRAAVRGKGIPDLDGNAFDLPFSLIETLLPDGKTGVYQREDLEYFHDGLPAARAVLDSGDLETFLLAPLMWDGRTIGLLSMSSATKNAFSVKDRRFLKGAAQLIAGSVGVSLASEHLREQVDHRRLLADLNRLLDATESPEQAFEEFASRLQKALPFDGLRINLADTEAGSLTYRHNNGDPGRHESGTRPFQRAFAEYIVRENRVLNVTVDETGIMPGRGFKAPQGIRSVLAAPLRRQERAIGAIQLYSLRESAFDQQDETLLERVAEQVSGVFAREAQSASLLALERERTEAAELAAQNTAPQQDPESRELFLDIVSGELKTPLTAIFASASILESDRPGNLTERQMEHLTVIRRNSARLNLLINDLLHVTRLKAGALSMMLTRFTGRELADEVAGSMGVILNQKGQRLAVEISGDNMPVTADRDKIQQVAANLISNASTYSENDSDIRLVCSTHGGRLRVAVVDNGGGMKPEELSRAFEPVVRTAPENAKHKAGTGFGLHVAKSIVEAHGGEIFLVSAPGEGTVAGFWIPLAPPRDADF